MAFDTSIFRTQQVQPLQPMNALMQGLQVQGAMQGNALQKLQMGDVHAQRQLAIQKAEQSAAQQQKKNALYEGLRRGEKLDPAALLDAGVSREDIAFLANAGTLGMPEVARTVQGAGPDGRPVTQQRDKFGRLVGDVIPEAVKLQLENMGGQSVAFDPYALKPGQQFQRTQTPDSIASNAVAMRGQNMVDARSREANGAGKPPAGYRFKSDGSLEAIPGGPADIKAGAEGAKAEAKKSSTVAAAKGVLDTIKEANDLVGVNTAGVGSWLTALPATEARNLAAKLETVKANLGFDRLQQMRDQSPTGGALGAVAVQELVALQATVSSLDQAQSPAQLRSSLKKIEGHYKRWLQTMGEKDAPMPKIDTSAGVPGVKFLGFE